MQKKIITSLLVSPMAISAMANINVAGVTASGWESDGINDNPIAAGNIVHCPVGTGVLKQVFTAPAPGTYTVKFGAIDNAAVSVADTVGKGVKWDLGEGTMTFVVKEKDTEITLIVSPVDASKPFGFTQGKTAIVFDFGDTDTRLNDSINKVAPLDTVTDEDTSDIAKSLRARYAQLLNDSTAARNMIQELADSAASTDSIKELNAYVKFEMFNAPNDLIAKAIEKLRSEVEAYNDSVNTQNAIFEAVEINTAAKAKYLTAWTNLKDSLGVVSTDLGKFCEVVQNAYNDSVAKIDTIITNYKNAVDTTYADDKLATPNLKFTFTPDSTAIMASITKLAADIKVAVDNDSTYHKWAVEYPTLGLEKEYNQSRVTITGLKGVEPVLNVYAPKQALWMDSIATAYNLGAPYNPAADNTKIPHSIDITSDSIVSARDSVLQAIGDIKAIVANAKALQENQNGEMTKANDYLKSANDALDAATKGVNDELLKGLGVDSLNIVKYNQHVDSVKNAIQVVKDTCVKHYKLYDLSDKYYTDLAIETVVNAQQALTTFIDDLGLADLQKLALAKDSLQNKLDSLQNTINAEKDSLGVNIQKTFKGTVDNLQAAIDAFKALENKGNIDKSIDGAFKNLEDLVGALKVSKNVIDSLNTAAGELDGYVEKKQETKVDGSNFNYTAYSKKSLGYADSVANWTATYTGLGEITNPQKCFDAATNLGKTVTAFGWLEEVTKSFNNLEDGATEANYNAVNEAYAKAAAGADTLGMDTTKLFKALDSISNVIATQKDAVNWDSIAQRNAKVDTLVDVDKALAGLLTDINAVLSSQALYVENNKSLADVDSLIKKLKAYNLTTTSGEEAQAYFAKLIADTVQNNGVDSIVGLQGENNILKDKLKSWLQEGKLNEANLSALANEIKDLTTKINNMETRIKNNENALSTLLTESTATRNAVNGHITNLQNNFNDKIDDVDKAIQALEDLLNTDLLDVDTKVTNTYNEGLCNDSVTVFTKQYEAIRAQADTIFNNLTKEYTDQVKKFNDEVYTESGFEAAVGLTNNTYLSAITVFNGYKGLTNAGYLNYLKKDSVYKSHEAVYEYASKIRELKADAQKAVKDSTAKAVTLDLEKFTKTYTDSAAKFTAAIKQMTIDIVKAFNKAGDTYKDSISTLADAAYDAAYDALTDVSTAGLTADEATDVLKPSKEWQTKADAVYGRRLETAANDSVLVADYKKMSGFVVDTVANYLDNLLPEINLAKSLLDNWDAAYTPAKDSLATMQTNAKAFEYVDPESKKEDLLALLATNIIKADSLNTDFVGYNQTKRLENLATSKAMLAYLLKAAGDLYTEVKDLNDGNYANKEAYDKYINDSIPALNAQLDSLKKFVNPMGVAYGVEYDGIVTKINAYKAAIEANKSQLDTKQGDLKVLFDAAVDAIETKYDAVAADEVVYLGKLIDKAKVAYNNAREANKDNDFAEMNAKIDSISDVVKGLLGLSVTPGADATAWSASAVVCENSICGIINDLQKEYNPEKEETAATVQAALDALNQVVVDSIAAGQLYLGDCEDSVQAEFGSKYTEIDAAREAIVSAYNADVADGSIIAKQGNYTAQLKDLLKQLEDLKPLIAAAQEKAAKKAASDAVAKGLEDQYTDLKNLLDGVKTTFEGYEIFTKFEPQYVDADTLLRDMNTWIATQKADTAFVEGDTYETAYNIEYKIKSLNLDGLDYYASDVLAQKAEVAIKAVSTYVNDNKLVASAEQQILAKVAEYEASLASLNDSVVKFVTSDYIKVDESGKTLDDAQYPAGETKINGYIGDYTQLISDAEALLAEAKQNEYVPGDVDGDGVNVSDIQTLLAWIGEDVTYADLYAESPALANAADMNGDGQITIVDVTILSNMILNPTAPASDFAKVNYAMKRQVLQSKGSISAVPVSMEDGIRTYAITLDNNEAFVSGQLDLRVEGTSEIVGVSAADRLSGHEVLAYENEGFTRVLIHSLENAEFEGNQGATIYVQVKGRSGLGIDNILFSTGDAQGYTMNGKAPGTTGIDNIIETGKVVKEAIYDAAGRMYNKVRRGINIIRHSDGTVTKELRK